MKYRTLGRTGLNVSVVSLGTGGPSRIGQRTHGDEPQSHRVIRRALELGINLIDTAANCSDSEAILGRALKDVPRDNYIIATKFAPDPDENDTIITPQALIESCERSLRRLQVETIDIYQFHGVVPHQYSEVVERLFPTAQMLQRQGKIRYLGVTEYFYKDPKHQMLETALADDIWDTIMVKYGILNMSAQWRVLPLAQEKNVGVLNMSAVRVKMTRPGELEKIVALWNSKGLIPPDALPDHRPLDFLIHDDVPSVIAAGYKFGLSHEAIHTLLVGTGNVEHLEENTATLLGPPLPPDDLQRLHSIFGQVAESEGDTG